MSFQVAKLLTSRPRFGILPAMVTGELRNKVDPIWKTIWTGGITSPITVLAPTGTTGILPVAGGPRLSRHCQRRANRSVQMVGNPFNAELIGMKKLKETF